MSQIKSRKGLLMAAVAGIVLTGALLMSNNTSALPELPPQWQQSQNSIDRLTMPTDYDYVHDLDDATLAAAYDAILTNSQCSAVSDSQLAERNEQFFSRHQADFMQGVFSVNNIARELNRIQINLLMEDARIRANDEGELLSQDQRDIINTYQTRDDGLTVHPDDINPTLLREVQNAYPDHPVARMDFGGVQLEDRFRLLTQFWAVDEVFEINQGVDCSKLNDLVSLVKETLGS